MPQPSRDPLTEVLLGLKHPHQDVRQRAAIALGSLVTPERARQVAELLWQESDFFVRESLVWVLARIPQAALPYAVAALADERAEVRLRAVHLVSKIGDPSAVPAVLPLTADADDDVAARARFALTRLGDPASIPALTAYLGRGGDDRRTELTRDLASFGEAALPYLRQRLGDRDQDVREHAAWVITVIGEEPDLTLTRRERPGSGS